MAFIEVDKDRATGGFQLAIGDGRTGYRISGPKYCAQSSNILRHEITSRDAGEILDYIKPLLPNLIGADATHEIFYLQLADDGTSIRKWSRSPFDGARICRVAFEQVSA